VSEAPPTVPRDPLAHQRRNRLLAGGVLVLSICAIVAIVRQAGDAGTADAARAQALPSGQPFTLTWGGDLTPGSSYGLPPGEGRSLLAAVRRRMRRADLATLNLEGTFGVGGRSKCPVIPSATCFAFQAPPRNASALRDAGVDVVNLANNHAFDFGARGMGQTVRALRRAGVRMTGRPGEIAVLRLPRARVAFLGFAAYRWASPIRDLATVRALVDTAAKLANVVVIFMHAGAEGSDKIHTPNVDEQAYGELRGNPRAFAHTAVDAGADLVLGSGPHVLRGIELYKHRLIAYSLGNLGGYRNFGIGGNSALSALLRVRVGADGAFASGSLFSLRLSPAGIASADPTGAAGRLVTAVSAEDFGARAVAVGRRGALSARASR
jgi:Bacterial capsule synthesis protein PGA_cap